MTKFQKLSQIYKDIELLESYGDFKAADVLHKKFIREAQLVSNEVKSYKDLMTEFYILAQNPNDDFENLVNWYQNDPGRYTQEEREYIDKAVEKATDQRSRMGKFTTVLNPDNPTLVKEHKSDSGSVIIDKPIDGKKTTKQKVPILNDKEQGYVYRRIIGQIKRLLLKNLQSEADKLALDYSDFFENPKRNDAFVKQVNKIYENLEFSSPI
jgi:hypothetical protein